MTTTQPRRLRPMLGVLATAAALVLTLFTAAPAQAAEPVRDPANARVLVNKDHPLSPATYSPSLVAWKNTGHRMRSDVRSKLSGLFTGAANAGHSIIVVSAYRSYAQQRDLYNYYVRVYGKAYADRISARPGYSEHQTGLAVDVGLASGSCGLSACFGDTAAGKWVAANAYKYGFIIRYPKGHEGTTGYTYEPWHLRYVGTTLAAEMRTKKIPTMEHYYVLGKPSVRSYADVLAADSAGELWRYPGGGSRLHARVRIDTAYAGVRTGTSVDWNRDGTIDLLLQMKDGRLLVNIGKAGGGFHAPRQVGSGFARYDITVGNWVSADRYPGLVAKRWSDGAMLYYRNGSGAGLSAGKVFSRGWGKYWPTLLDWNQDGKQDIVAVRRTGELYVYPGNGTGAVSTSASARKQIGGSGWDQVAGITPLYGYTSSGSTGFMAKFRDGKLRYYPYSKGRFGTRTQEGTGFKAYNVFR
ncbi:M15 family metallopeptidase [Crystallibacter crystallopoietes]|nr:M15 family metallopeptidase [Arthrobacter crystallopoietes]